MTYFYPNVMRGFCLNDELHTKVSMSAYRTINTNCVLLRSTADKIDIQGILIFKQSYAFIHTYIFVMDLNNLVGTIL